MHALSRLTPEVRQYLLVTGNYWAFTLTDGALRMLVVLHFHQLGYTPLQLAALFLFYELFGVVTNCKRPARPPFARTPRPASCAFSSRGFIWKRCTRGARPGLGTSRPGGAAG